jgi:hypothetical protein
MPEHRAMLEQEKFNGLIIIEEKIFLTWGLLISVSNFAQGKAMRQ